MSETLYIKSALGKYYITVIATFHFFFSPGPKNTKIIFRKTKLWEFCYLRSSNKTISGNLYD